MAVPVNAMKARMTVLARCVSLSLELDDRQDDLRRKAAPLMETWGEPYEGQNMSEYRDSLGEARQLIETGLERPRPGMPPYWAAEADLARLEECEELAEDLREEYAELGVLARAIETGIEDPGGEPFREEARGTAEWLAWRIWGTVPPDVPEEAMEGCRPEPWEKAPGWYMGPESWLCFGI
jgi:hypothetical protein